MGRFAFLYLTAFASLCFSTKQLHAQEQGIEKAAASSMEADHSGAVDGVSAVGSRQTNADKFKEKPSLLEEFFSSPLNYFLLLVVCLYVYLMFVQPRGVRQEKKLQLQRLVNLKKNDRVVTSAGIHGIVSNINTEAGTVTLRVDESSNTRLTIDRDSIRSVAS